MIKEKDKRLTNEYLRDLELKAKQLNKDAIYELACLYSKGEIVSLSKEMSINLFTLSSNLGNKDASFELGMIYFNRKNYSMSKRYFLRSSRKESFFYLGMIEENGYIKTSSLTSALDYYLIGAKLGQKECIKKVIAFYKGGLGVKKNDFLANKYQKLLDKDK